MSISIIPLGGYGEVGRNCTAIDVDGDIFLFDLGLHVENYVRLVDESDDNGRSLGKSILSRHNAIPNLDPIKHRLNDVKAILISHAHLDHVGAVSFLANSFPFADIHGLPFTMNVAHRMAVDKRAGLKNQFFPHHYAELFKLTDSVSAEFVEVTHSTPHTAAIALHTPDGNIVYLNDFKLDPAPTLGNPTNLHRLTYLKPKALIIDTLYADSDSHTLGELHAQELLTTALLSRDLHGKIIIVSTFASHIARIHSIAAIAKELGRELVIVGRSMAKYLDAAKDVGLSSVVDQHDVVRYGSKARHALENISDPSKCLFLVTGGMGEPKAVLSRILDENLLPLKRDDLVIFSNSVIPVPSILEQRDHLERKLKKLGLEVLKGLHVSGHGAKKDMEEVLTKLKPEFVIPVHSEDETREQFVKVAKACGIKEEHVLVLHNGDETEL